MWKLSFHLTSPRVANAFSTALVCIITIIDFFKVVKQSSICYLMSLLNGGLPLSNS